MSSHSLLQGIYATQGLNPGFLHCRQILYRLSNQRWETEASRGKALTYYQLLHPFNPYNNPTRWLLLKPFCRWENVEEERCRGSVSHMLDMKSGLVP